MSSCDSATSTAATTFSCRIALVFVALATVIGGLIRFWGLGSRDFWFDESCTYIYVHYLLDWPFASSFLVESTNTPYYVLLRVWSEFFGETEACYRSLSAFAAALTVPLVSATAWRLRGAFAGVVTAVLVTVHPLHIYYAREARAYALWMLFLSVAMYALVVAAKTGRRRWWVAFGAAMLLSLHTHYFSVYFLAGSVACVFLSTNRRRTAVQWAITAGMVAIAFLPWLFLAVLPAASLGGAKWVAPGFDAIAAIPQSLWAMLPCGAYPGHLRGLSVESTETVSQTALLVVCARVLPAVLLALIAVVVVRRQAKEASNSLPRACFFLVGVSVAPLVLAWLYAVAVSPNYLVGRYDMVGWPAFVVLFSIVVSELAGVIRKGLMLSLIACAVLVTCSAVPLMRMSAIAPMKSLHRQRAEAIATLAGSDDLVITFSYDRDAMFYYLHRAGCDVTVRSFPGWLDDQIGWVDSEADLAEKRRAIAIADAQLLASDALRRLAGGHRVFLMADSTDPKGTGMRTSLHAKLWLSLRDAGLATVTVDPEMLIYEVRLAE